MVNRAAEIIELMKKGYVLCMDYESFIYREGKIFWWRPGLVDDKEFKGDFNRHLEMMLCTSKAIKIDNQKMSIEI